MTKIVSPDWGTDTVNTARDIVRNNEGIRGIDFEVETIESWLPTILVSCGFFTSNSDVKRKRPDLFRDLEMVDGLGEIIRLQWCEIWINLKMP